MEWLSQFSDWLKKHSGTPLGLVGILVVPLVILQLVPDDVWTPRAYWITLLILEFFASASWLYFRRGGISSQKLRLVLAIYYDKEDQRAELEEDFSKTLRKILREGDLGKDVELVTASRSECESIECDADLTALSDKKKAHLLLYGRIRTRTVEGKEIHLVELRAVVRHAKLAEHAARAFQEEISSVFPSEMIRIPKSDQLPHFRITAEWIGFSSRYLISLAAFTVGDFNYAQKILKDAELLLPRLPANVKQRSALEERIRHRQHEAAVLQAHKSYAAWRITRDLIEVERIRERLTFASEKARLRPENVHLLASAIFIATIDANTAEKMIRAAMFDHPIAHLNVAFLCAWQGKFDLARKSYRSAIKKNPDTDAMDQVFTFFDWLGADRPDYQYICNWCEAMLRRSSEEDLLKAERILGVLVRMEENFPMDEIARMREDLVSIQSDRKKDSVGPSAGLALPTRPRS